MKTKILIIALLSLTLGNTILSGQEVIDAMVAVVGDKIILKSEIVQKVANTAMQQGISRGTKQYNDLTENILQELITQKILLIKARQDTITIEDKRVDAELDKRIEEFITRAGSKEKVEENFGLPIKQLKRKFRPELKDYLLVSKVKQSKIAGIRIYPEEVETFFNTIKDSLPVKPAMVKMRHILIGIKAGNESYNKAIARIQQVQKGLSSGKSFADLAALYSEDPGTSDNGGQLGYIGKGEIFQEFEDAAFSLKIDEVSQPIQTQIGLHLIKCLDIKDDKVKVAHIFIKIAETAGDEQTAAETALRIRNEAIAGAPFDSLARLYSDDETSAAQGGEIAWTSLENMQIETFKLAVDTLKVGDITMPFKTQFGYHLVLKEDEQDGRPFSLKEDFKQLEEGALAEKQNKVFLEWIEELKKDLYINIKRDLLK